ncbi:MAG: 50S ribosomal protein L35 [Candidatus Omnitrophota bacterium]|nr:50S ribosomal protein L35 [Candidatus Omnitrophota bacterium]
MPKLKTKKGAAKRFKLTKNKKIKYAACGKGHMMSHKNTRRLRKLRRRHILSGGKGKLVKYLKRILPYG